LKVLKQNLLWLDEWEKNLEDGLIQEKEFLTKATSESLRLTLKSTIDLVLFLLEECGFSYVLTSKLNQDNLEVSNYNFILYLKFLNAIKIYLYTGVY